MPKGQKKIKTAAEIEAEKKERRKAFESTVGGKVSKAVAAVNNLAKTTNRQTYEYDSADIAKIKTALETAVSNCIAGYEAAVKAPKPGKVEPFSFK